MTWPITCLFLAVFCLSGFINIDGSDSFDTRNQGKESRHHTAGSGGWALSYSDDEDLMDSGSGSGSGFGDLESEKKSKATPVPGRTTVKPRTSDHPLTDCENARQTSQTLRGKYAPRCLPNGDFDSLQCHGYPGTGDCWCSDLQGRDIPGTLMEAPNYPSCDDGSNLPPCVYQLVKHVRSKLLGSFRPKCTADGQFERTQCQGSICYCVDAGTGNKITGSEVHIPDTPKCDMDTSVIDVAEQTTRTSTPDTEQIVIDGEDESRKPTTEGRSKTDKDMDKNIEIDKGKEKKMKKDDDTSSDDNKTGKDEEVVEKPGQEGHQDDKVEKASQVMTQPGILAGIIGGSVVLLLCLVLLIMFIVYRMRKKDEGSYPLDEPRKTPNYNYMKAPEKEFYA